MRRPSDLVPGAAVRVGVWRYFGALRCRSFPIPRRGLHELHVSERCSNAWPAHFVTANPARRSPPRSPRRSPSRRWLLIAATATIAVGYNVMFLLYQPRRRGRACNACRMSMHAVLRARHALPVAAVGIGNEMPLDYLWWRLIGYFG